MRIHTSHPLAHTTVICRAALDRAKAAGRVSPSVYFDKITAHRSTTHTTAAEVHLVSDVKEPGSKRRRPNSGTHGADGAEVWAATWDEWGWFLAEVFAADPGAKCAAWYPDRQTFHARTDNKFHPVA